MLLAGKVPSPFGIGHIRLGGSLARGAAREQKTNSDPGMAAARRTMVGLGWHENWVVESIDDAARPIRNGPPAWTGRSLPPGVEPLSPRELFWQSYASSSSCGAFRSADLGASASFRLGEVLVPLMFKTGCWARTVQRRFTDRKKGIRPGDFKLAERCLICPGERHETPVQV